MSDGFTRFLAGCFGAFTVLVLAGGAGAGSDKGRMAEITKNGGCPGCDLELAELRALKLENADFKGAKLREVDLKEAVLPNGRFQKSDFRRTEAERADFRR
ncbi:pentapeptide repeat-containing protein [Roseibium salinum]|uniref:pentapeptide repeat-containing protein n=1 Tax=Roseibium salinum TaxID=1604349 RepID=UPI00360DC267